MNKIDHEIPAQNFELIRDMIASILKIELSEQKNLKSLTEEIKVFSGLNSAFNQADELLIDVIFGGFNISQQNQFSAMQDLEFYIDVYASGKGLKAGEDSGSRRDSFVGMITYILMNEAYKTLGFETGFIGGSHIEGCENYILTNEQDASRVKVSRLTINIKCNQQSKPSESAILAVNKTGVRLDETDRGYEYVFNNQ